MTYFKRNLITNSIYALKLLINIYTII